MKYLALAVIFLAGCATEKGNIRQAQHSADQIKMIAVQRQAQMDEKKAEADSNKQLYDSLARICEANKEHCPATTVALAVIGALGAESDDDDNAPIVQLREQRDIGLEYAKVLATPVSTVLTGVAIAGLQAQTQRNASDNNRDILLGDQQADLGIVSAVAGLGEAAASSIGISAGGDIYQVQDNASIDQSQNTTDSYNTSTTDSYNTSSSADSSADTNLNYTASDQAFINAGVADYTDYIIDYQGTNMSLAELVAALNAAGAAYSIDLDGTTVAESDGDGSSTETVYVNCDAAQFSPKPPVCN